MAELLDFHLFVTHHLGEIRDVLPDHFELTLVARDTSSGPGNGFVISNDKYDLVIKELEAAGNNAVGKSIVDLRVPNA